VSKMPESRCRSSAACDGCEEVPGTPQHYHRSSTVVIAFPKRMAPRPAIHLPATLLLGNALGSHQSSESSFSGDERSLNSGLDQAAPLHHVDDVRLPNSGQPVQLVDVARARDPSLLCVKGYRCQGAS
jgi:hypothetical protein